MVKHSNNSRSSLSNYSRLSTLPSDPNIIFILQVTDKVSQQTEGVKLGAQIPSTCGNFIYHISIIDYLQKYDLGKKTERFWKTTFKGAIPKELSSTNPSLYAERFSHFMQSKVFKTDAQQQPLMTNERSTANFLKINR